MLWTIFVILLVLWALGLVSSYTLGGYIHILLIIAVAVLLIRIIQGQSRCNAFTTIAVSERCHLCRAPFPTLEMLRARHFRMPRGKNCLLTLTVNFVT